MQIHGIADGQTSAGTQRKGEFIETLNAQKGGDWGEVHRKRAVARPSHY
jgi:hypothetical protein